MNRLDTKLIFIHCSATLAKQDIGAQTINKWHLERGMHSDRGLTGYNFVIRRSGLIELGRDLPAIGAHVQGFNNHSVGICLVGGVRKANAGESADSSGMVPENNFTAAQMDSLETLLKALKLVYPDAPIAPHNAVSNKACPSFDVWKWQMARFGISDELHAKKVIAEIQRENQGEN